MYAFAPLGDRHIVYGRLPTLMTFEAVNAPVVVLRFNMDTVVSYELVTYRYRPSGEIAIDEGAVPTYTDPEAVRTPVDAFRLYHTI